MAQSTLRPPIIRRINGISSDAGWVPALPEITSQIESAVLRADEDGGAAPEGAKKAARQEIEVKSHYLDRLKELVDFKVIRERGLKIAFDPMWGASRGYSDVVLRGKKALSARWYTTRAMCCLADMLRSRMVNCLTSFATR